MRKLIFVIITLGVFASLGFSQTATTRYETDFQLWNETQIIVPLTKAKDWNFVLSFLGRFGNNVSMTTDARVGGMFTKKMNKYVTLGFGALYQYSNPTFVRRRYGSRYIGTATFTLPLGHKFTLVNRNQVQYENRYSRPNILVIRPRALIKREVKVGKTTIEPFVSWEPFYDTRLKAISRYREQIGVSHKFSPQFSADFYYVRQDETGNHTRPGTLNGIGTTFRINVR